MALYLDEATGSDLIDMPMALAAVEEAHRELASGSAIDVPRQRTRLPKSALHLLQGALPTRDAIGYKAYTTSREGARFLVHLFSASTGALRAVLAADRLGMMRTAAVSGLATRLLARPEADVLGLFGAGWQAEGHLEAIAAVRPLRLVKVHARNPERLSAFCARMGERFGGRGLRVEACASAEATVRGSAIVSTVTTATEPLFDADWLEPGTHLNAAGSNALIRREIGEDVVRRCRPVVVDSLPTALKEAGDLLPLLEKGRLAERQLVELGDILLGLRPGRQVADDITLFESQGLGLQDIALAVRVEALARERGLGVALPYGA